ncbi:phage/plasmid primase, P4 family [Acuticoccus sp. M5D2P5]|uniref:phage/plasmid primase, P4 family n=1 Tax=Acuticoccus kalidii TaxID=2910977 RepID=UPI001F47724C|nr:phage/plasmid primase, P4 family [Acuticoccus kalidii]MCF3933287.1 phage/plasmid primase, P4 family [Acuticoccus kalidii]
MVAVLDAALALAARGWPVFPCNPANKRPLTRNGLKDATTDEGQIRAWWQKWPDALIGLPTGGALGAFVVDLDPRDVDCETLWRELEAHLGESLGDPIIAITQSGGWHAYFAMPDGESVPNRQGGTRGMLPHVDVRGDGGYVIAPPSVMLGGNVYRWKGRNDGERGLTAPPAALIDYILRRGAFEPEKGDRAAPAVSSAKVSDHVRRYALAAMDAETRACEAAVAGTRSDQLNRSAFALGQLVGAGALSESMVQAALEDVARAWPSFRKSCGTIRGGIKAGLAQPRDLKEVEASAERRGGRSWDASRGDRDSRDMTGQSRSVPPDHSPAPPPQAGEPRGAPSRGGDGKGGGELDPETLATCADYELSDTGNAYRLKAWFGDDLLHVHGLGWHRWDGKRWEFEGGEYGAVSQAQEVAKRVHEEAALLALSEREKAQVEHLEAVLRGDEVAAHEDNVVPLRSDLEIDRKLAETRLRALKEAIPKRQRERSRHAVHSGNASRIRGTLEMAEPLFNVPVAAVDRDKLAINVLNGTIRLIEAPDPDCPDPDVVRMIPAVRLDPHRPEDRITKLMACGYDPGATAPRWQAFLERFLPDPEVREFIQTFYGYGLIGLTSAQVFLFHYGSGANGKSTFMEALRRLMGDYARVLQAEAVTGEHMARSGAASPEFARLGGARFVQVSELPKGAPLKEETIKLLTGGEPMTVRYLMKDPFELVPEFTASLTGNSKPTATGSDYAVFRRLRLIHWGVRIEEHERRPMAEVLAEFEAEAAGILNWLIEGLLRYRAIGLRAPSAVVDATEDYRSDMDPVGEFIRECVERREGETVEARPLYLAYVSWCEANAIRPYSEKRFASEASASGLIRDRSRIRKYINIRLKDVPLRQEEDNFASAWGGSRRG